ncbi:alpha/beta hydrolase family protein [Alteriqipengyuania lutimaris]|uniref:Alpha/beta hydrolase n=1 Tax=Alteriqipengyuania lutimaris TaxID=1538146 RepID=A0A395LLG3_9SPHN|nr:alpha/beta hydrolase [Alteriqipengyuania lutimaris]MBB3033098.1 hypothetical protein [Alteriqipengyuania lutimaris]RDS77838.1 alpha/beta hydrolase [Alteriqipengyuania lutimaris]
MGKFLIGLAWATLWLGAPATAQEMALDSAQVPASGEIEQLAIPSVPGVVIAGTLRLPKGHGEGPFPLVVCFAGSGKWSRGGYHLLSERLLARGIAMFELDKRGAGQSTGTFTDSITEHVIDGHAVIRALRIHKSIDGARIGVCGLSQGGTVAPSLAAQDSEIAAVVTFAGPVGRRGELFLDALRRTLLGSYPQAHQQVDVLVAATESLMDAYQRDASAAEIEPLREAVIEAMVATGFTRAEAENTYAVLDTPQTRSMYAVGSFEDLQALDIPVLALFADRDRVVEAQLNASAAAEALRGNADAAVFTVAGYGHTFQPVDPDTGDATGGAMLDAPEVLELVADWLARRFGVSAR